MLMLGLMAFFPILSISFQFCDPFSIEEFYISGEGNNPLNKLNLINEKASCSES